MPLKVSADAHLQQFHALCREEGSIVAGASHHGGGVLESGFQRHMKTRANDLGSHRAQPQ